MSKIKSLFRKIWDFFVCYPLATAATVVLFAFAVVVSISGKTIQIGGLLGLLWGKKHPKDLPGYPIITPPNGRVDDKGSVIQPGQSDDKGFVQVPVVLPIKEPGILSDPTTVTVVDIEGKNIILPLPKGVKNKDVKEVIMVSPNVFQISNNDSGVDASKLLKEITK